MVHLPGSVRQPDPLPLPGAVPHPDPLPLPGVALSPGVLPLPPHPQLHVPKAIDPEVPPAVSSSADTMDMDTAIPSSSSVRSLRWFCSPDHTQSNKEVPWEGEESREGEAYWEGTDNKEEDEEEKYYEDKIFHFFRILLGP